jgi:hypothetical protein
MDTAFFLEIILEMREYQRVNNIKQKCITNTQYLYNTAKALGVANSFKAEAVITASYDKDNNVTKLFMGHMILSMDGTLLIDPSYEVFSLPQKIYFYTIKELTDFMPLYKKDARDGFNLKEIVTTFMRFRIYADAINSGEFVSDKKYYEELDYYLGI